VENRARRKMKEKRMKGEESSGGKESRSVHSDRVSSIRSIGATSVDSELREVKKIKK